MKRSIPAFVALLLIFFSASAQKLPNIQEKSEWLPVTTKIDAKLTEWNGALKAYNKAALVEYTIANDDKNLYLAISSKDKTTTAKILAGGISFILNNSIVTFPLTPAAWIYSSKTGFADKNYKVLSDSISIRNEIAALKDIKVLKLNGVSDSILSVYNPYGIKGVLAYTNETLISELSIPLDRIGLSNQRTAEFIYKIRLNGVPLPPRPTGIPIPTTYGPPIMVQTVGVQEKEMIYVTDFEGKYTMAKK